MTLGIHNKHSITILKYITYIILIILVKQMQNTHNCTETLEIKVMYDFTSNAF